MRNLLVCALMLALVGSAMAIDLGNERPAKPAINAPENVPAGVRQGGDTILDAVLVTLPYNASGTTAGYTNDYAEVCPYSGSTSPDVVYTFTPATSDPLNVDLGGSAYDTKVYMYDSGLNLVACNDDFYSDYTSKLENVAVVAGEQYFVIVDGYGGYSGSYVIAITGFVPCILECPAGAAIEGEPTIVDGYVDNYNGGCNTAPAYPFQAIASAIFCGKTGYYLSAEGGSSRDTDWFTMIMPAGGVLEITGDAEEASYMFELGPQDCGSVGVLQNVTVGPCTPNTITITGTAGSTVWFWFGPTTFQSGTTYEYDYVLNTNLIVPVENHSWTGVKSLFN